MLKRTIEKTVNTPAYARITARWALRSAATTPTGSYYPLITAKIFTAFMFEGAIDYLGETLCPTWNTSSSRPNRAPAWQPLAERHKAVRRLLNLDNGNREYDDIRAIVDRLFRFRDSFAHPKVLEQTIQDSVPNAMAAAPEIAWEAEVDATLVQSDFDTLEAYSVGLLDTAADCLESVLERGWDEWQQKYPHLTDLHLEAAYLRGILHSPSYFSADYSP
jgi:hypothetical protein